MILESESYPVKMKNAIKIENDNEATARWMCNVKLEKYYKRMLTQTTIAAV